MGTTRIADLAAEFGMGREDLRRWLAAKGIHVPNHQTGLDNRQVTRARVQWERGKRPAAQLAQSRKGKAKRKKAARRREPPRSQWTIPIDHRANLARLIDHEIRERYKGSTNLAWEITEQVIEDYCRRHGEPRFANLSRPQLHRLRYAQRPSIGEAGFWWLLFLIPDERALRHALFSPGARALLQDANSFYDHRELARSVERKEARQRVIQAMRASSREARQAFEKFDGLVRRKGHSKETAELALDRVAAPFALVPETGYVDREWEELSPGEQWDYVRYALARERILLDREPDLERVQQKGFNRYLAALGEPGAQTRRRLLRRRSSPH